MKRLGRLIAAGIVVLPAAAMPAAAGPAEANQLLACQANRSDVAAVSVADLRIGFEANYVWANANVQLTMRNGQVRAYKLSGRADPVEKPPRPNQAKAGFAYPGFTCVVQYRAITSVRNCAGARQRRSCEIGVTVFGVPMVYAVSMTAERDKVVEASTIP